MSNMKSVGLNIMNVPSKINFSLALFVMLLTGCTATVSTHQFQYYGTDALLSGRDFEYVRFGLTGKSYTSYSVYRSDGGAVGRRRGGGAVRDGMVADAKRDLRNQYELGPNEAYSNVSIDVLTTRTGPMSAGGLKENKIALTVVITADVVRLGGAVATSSRDWTVGGTLESLPEVNVVELGDAEDDISAPAQELSERIEAAPSQSDWRREEGRTVYFIVKKKVRAGVIIATDGALIGLKYYSTEGKKRSKWVRSSKIFKTTGEAQAALGSQGE